MSDGFSRPRPDGGPKVEPYINPNAPFGPVASEQITDRLLRDELFDRENRAYAHLTRHDPAFVVGRRRCRGDRPTPPFVRPLLAPGREPNRPGPDRPQPGPRRTGSVRSGWSAA